MVVECGKCGTRFKLDASRLPDEGIRVRCSRCKHAFFLQNPASSPEQAIDAVASETASQPAHAMPGMTQDLPIQQDPSVSDGSGSLDELDGLEEEDDWEFNEEPPIEEEVAPIAAPPAVAEPSFDEQNVYTTEVDGLNLTVGDHDESVELDTGGFNEQPCIDIEADESSSSDDLDLEVDMGPVSSPVAAAASEEPVHSDLPAPDQPAPGFGGERADAFGTVDDFSSLMEPDEHEAAADQGASADLEDPSSWDFFSNDDLKSVTPPARDVEAGVSTAGSSRDIEDLIGGATAGASDVSAVDGLAPEDRKPIGSLQRIGTAIGWTLTLCLLGIGVWRGLVYPLNSGVRPPAYVDVGPLRAAEINGRWLDTAHAGLSYAITGELVNPGTSEAVAGVSLKVVLLDREGLELTLDRIPVGLGLTTDDIREMTPAQWMSSLDTAGRRLEQWPVPAGESVSFLAMIEKLPEQASHFQLTVNEPESLPNEEVTNRTFPQ